MKRWTVLSLFGVCCCSSAYGQQLHPLDNVVQLLNNMVAQVEKDAQQEMKAYREFTDWCSGTAGNGQHAVDLAEKEKAKLEAEVAKDQSDKEVAHAKLEEHAAAVAEAEAEMKKAKEVRQLEREDFEAGEKELMEMVDALGRAITILEKKGATALAQVDTTNLNSIVQALGAVLDAASFPTSDRSKLLALVQAKQAEEDGAGDVAALGAPNAEAYQSKGGNIVEVMENMKDEAETQLSELRQNELKAKGEFDLLMASLKDRLGEDSKGMGVQKGDESEATEEKATDTGDLQNTETDLEESNKELKTVQSTCLTSAADHDKTVASRKEELDTLAKAIELLKNVVEGGASFVQVEAKALAGVPKSQVAHMVKLLAKQHHSAALAQLASRIAATVRSGAADPFGKVKAMIKSMVNKLETQGTQEAKEKEYCDREMDKATAKDDSLHDTLDDTTATIDSSASKTAQLKEQLKHFGGELAELAKDKAELDKIRTEQHEEYVAEKTDLDQALHGIRGALGTLRDYYGSDEEGAASAAMLQEDGDSMAFMQQPAPPEKHSKAEGAGASIIQVLEVIESEFAENLAKVESQEADEKSNYDKVVAEGQVAKASKDQDVKFITKKLKRLATRMTESEEDKENFDAELSAVEDYLAKLKERCIAKPDTFEERAKRRQAEIEGLKDALKILNEEAAAFFQHHRRGRRSLRAHPALAADSRM